MKLTMNTKHTAAPNKKPAIHIRNCCPQKVNEKNEDHSVVQITPHYYCCAYMMQLTPVQLRY